ncbi:MAG: hypothetical protein KKA19_05565 [Candidatus Margulisbacteria bacterium]|nr:hypothetical protein [Candidatus Margulisiibacteriota bacterium]
MKISSGFTLLELIVISAIISLLVVLILFPAKSLKDSITEKSSLHYLVSILRNCRQQAIAESTNIKIEFQKNEVILKKENTSGQTNTFKTIPLPQGLKLQKPVQIGFNSRGFPIQSNSIIFINNKGKERRITLAVGTGRITLY